MFIIGSKYTLGEANEFTAACPKGELTKVISATSSRVFYAQFAHH